ncbi:MAG: hypothetical protein R2834_07465 [Rhodothermales bacterium]
MAGIYIHIPRLSNHPASRVARSERGAITRLVRAIGIELAYYAESHARNETVETLYLAGFPDDLLDDEVGAVIEAVVAHFDTSAMTEVTLDVDPTTLDRETLRTYASLGISRLHLKAHSFFQEDRDRLALSGSGEQVMRGIEYARLAGFNALSIGFAFGLPDQPEEYWMANLQRAHTLHLPEIVFAAPQTDAPDGPPAQWARNLNLPFADPEWVYRYDAASRYLNDNAYAPYLLTSFARAEACSQHHLLVADHSHVLGIGPSAHSFWWHGSSYTRAHRWDNVTEINRYTDLLLQHQVPINTRSTVDMDTLAEEFLLFQLSTAGGVNLQRMETQYGVDLLTERIEVIASLEAGGLIEPIRNQKLRLTLLGRTHWEEVTHKLLS